MKPYDLRIDGDSIVYTAGFAADSREGELSHSLHNAKLIINSIREKFMPNVITLWLTNSDPSTNFRNLVVSDYKANRKNAPKPRFYKELRRYLIDKYKAQISTFGEADDELCIDVQPNTVIASKDKDLLMVPAIHYRIHTQEIIHSKDPGELRLYEKNRKKQCDGYGFKWFCYQMLYGDSVDNIHKPEKNYGAVKIYEVLSKYDNIYQNWKAVELFYRGCGKEDLLMINAKLLWMARKRNQIFSLDVLEELIDENSFV